MQKFSKVFQALPDGPNVYRLYTDGSASWKTRMGSWAYLICDQNDNERSRNTGLAHDTTIGRMELMAAIEGLRSLDKPSVVEIVTDSEYLGRGISAWMEAWKSSGWKVVNADLWKIIYELVNRHTVVVCCVRGHSGVPGNEIVDKMCSAMLKNYKAEN